MLLDGEEVIATHGVTSRTNPQPVDADSLLHIASVAKTVTATALISTSPRTRSISTLRHGATSPS